jgi:hypothetical protein
MAFLENGSPVATKLGPIATLQTSINGKASPTQIFALSSTARVWLGMSQTTAGVYNMVTSTGTCVLYVYDTSYELIQELTVNTTADPKTISSDFHRIECEASGALDLSITPQLAKVSSPGGTMVLNTITGSGNWGVGTGNATGGTSGYTAGQYAHVILVGASGGGGGASYANSPYGPYGNPGGSGGAGGVIANTSSAIALTGTYSFTVGTGGNAGTQSNNGGGNVGNAGNAGSGATTAFSLVANAGNGGTGANGRSGGQGGVNGNAGSPSLPTDTKIYLGVNSGEIGLSAGARGNDGNPVTQPTAGNGGRIIILRWTP